MPPFILPLAVLVIIASPCDIAPYIDPVFENNIILIQRYNRPRLLRLEDGMKKQEGLRQK